MSYAKTSREKQFSIHTTEDPRYSLWVSLEQIEARILELPPEERRRFAVWYEAHRKDLLPELEEEEDLADEQRAEILRRRDLALAHPELLEPWEGTVDRVRSKLHELRPKNPARC
jgi:hypothetical protein